MTQDNDVLFSSALGLENGTGYRLSRAIALHFAGKPVVEGLSSTFDLDELVAAGRCTRAYRSTPHSQIETEWTRSHGLTPETAIAIADVTWGEHSLAVARAEWKEGWDEKVRHFVVADDRAVAERFAEEGAAYCNEPHDAVLTFAGGCWSKDRSMWKEIERSSFEDLVLAGSLAAQIQDDFSSFLAARAEYARYGVPWKRGVLFVGPPGNGKTHCLRATIKLLGVPCLYVQSLKARYEPDDANIARVFSRAREVTPCCLVFEDLDAMITPENRSVFLNQLDGFANANGLLTLATTNHPERLDPAILERPSRFDRKYHFDLPSPVERARYAKAWNARLDAAMHLTEDQTAALVEGTEGFSFAYLKELFLSSMIRWMKQQKAGSMAAITTEQLKTLREQMTAEASAPPPTRETAADAAAVLRKFL